MIKIKRMISLLSFGKKGMVRLLNLRKALLDESNIKTHKAVYVLDQYKIVGLSRQLPFM